MNSHHHLLVMRVHRRAPMTGQGGLVGKTSGTQIALVVIDAAIQRFLYVIRPDMRHHTTYIRW